ncbi:MAG TPA: TlpA disulfide reductase family protein [Terriglobales bacterium]|nr:TlpA disulfide reductase family protein [Terriglobales bacterium]
MPALSAGKAAPEFTLEKMDGGKFNLREALSRGPVLAVFFKISCPVCQFALPYVERLYQAYAGKNVTVVGVSQNNKNDTAAFMREYKLTLPVLLDDTSSYPVSNAYGLTNVPTLFWIERDGEIGLSSVGWSRTDMEQINRWLAEAGRAEQAVIFSAGENVPDFRAG